MVQVIKLKCRLSLKWATNGKTLLFVALIKARIKMNNTYKLDTIIKVDKNLCIACGSCITGSHDCDIEY